MTSKRAGESPDDFSRRSLLTLLALAPLPILAGCKGAGPRPEPGPGSDAADRQVGFVVEAQRAISRREPGLPGLRSLARINEKMAEGLSQADLSLLAAALSITAGEQIARLARPIAMADVRSALSQPIDMAPYGRSFLDRTLAEARAREATEPAYRLQISRHRRRCYCLGDTPCWICVAMALILIIAIIAVIAVLI